MFRQFTYQLSFDITLMVKVTYKNIKSIRARLCPEECVVRISCPFFIKDKYLQELLESNKHFFLYKVLEWQSKEKINHDEVYVLGNKYLKKEGSSFKMEDNIIYAYSDYEVVKEFILPIAKKILVNKMEQFFPKHKMPFLRFKTGIKSYWGNFNKEKYIITLSAHLLHYPKEVIEYIICHEIAHIFEFNHSPKFYQILTKMIPNYRQYKRVLQERNYEAVKRQPT